MTAISIYLPGHLSQLLKSRSMSLAITTVRPFHTPILHDQAHIVQYTTSLKPTMTFWAITL